jgi:hypothetical protein
MVAHQDIRMNAPPRLLRRFSQRLQKTTAVLIVTKNRLTLVPAGHHVVNRANIFNAQGASHSEDDVARQKVSSQSLFVTFLGLTLSDPFTIHIIVVNVLAPIPSTHHTCPAVALVKGDDASLPDNQFLIDVA